MREKKSTPHKKSDCQLKFLNFILIVYLYMNNFINHIRLGLHPNIGHAWWLMPERFRGLFPPSSHVRIKSCVEIHTRLCPSFNQA